MVKIVSRVGVGSQFHELKSDQKKKTLWPLIMDEVQLAQNYRATTRRHLIPGTHLIKFGRIKGWISLGKTHWFWTQSPQLEILDWEYHMKEVGSPSCLKTFCVHFPGQGPMLSQKDLLKTFKLKALIHRLSAFNPEEEKNGPMTPWCFV